MTWQLLYPAIRHLNTKGPKLADHSLQEHLAVKETLDSMDKMGPGHPDFSKNMETLEKNLFKHIEEEETQIFPLLEKHLKAKELDDMGNLIEKMKVVAPTRPHPHMPATPPGNMFAGRSIANNQMKY
jgi:hemerythrin superfamily protein